MPASRPATERFWEKVDKNGPNGCWVWLASLGSTGYGQFEVDYKPLKAHRFAYILLVGPIPDGLELDHLCRNRPCVNPDHLEAVSHADNVQRGVGPSVENRLKTHCPQ